MENKKMVGLQEKVDNVPKQKFIGVGGMDAFKHEINFLEILILISTLLVVLLKASSASYFFFVAFIIFAIAYYFIVDYGVSGASGGFALITAITALFFSANVGLAVGYLVLSAGVPTASGMADLYIILLSIVVFLVLGKKWVQAVTKRKFGEQVSRA